MLGVFYGVAAALLAAFVVVGVILPRLADGAFARGAVLRASVFYRVVRVVPASRSRRAAIDVSLAGCLCVRGDFNAALAVLDRTEPQVVDSAARAAWLNNRAYASLRADRDLPLALRHAEDAVQLRPNVAGFRHTRGLALLAAGRVDEAIAELDGMWTRLPAGDAPPLLEAERCHDLGVAWTRKGERDYAADYFRRAVSIAPGTTWAQRAEAKLTDVLAVRGASRGAREQKVALTGVAGE